MDSFQEYDHIPFGGGGGGSAGATSVGGGGGGSANRGMRIRIKGVGNGYLPAATGV
jgi:hypothetical protein